MLTAGSLSPFGARFAVSQLIAVALVAAATLAPTQTARACPIIPQPLRLLYLNSERVVVARAGETTVVKRDDDSGATIVRTALKVSSTLKGESHEPLIYLYQWQWGEDQDTDGSPAETEEQMLLFLNRSDDGDGYALTDSIFGVKQLSEDDLRVYVKRIEELAFIMRQEKPDDAQIIEWLVRCAEEPATRWEGAIELSYGGQLVDDVADRSDVMNEEQIAAEEIAAPEPMVKTDDEMGQTAPLINPRMATIDPAAYDTQQLTEDQKSRLLWALLASSKLTEGDYLLIDVVKSFHNPQLIPFILQHLREAADESPYKAAELMDTVAEALKDEAINAYVLDFRESISAGYSGLYQNEEDSEATEEQMSERRKARFEEMQNRLNMRVEYFIALAGSVVPPN